MTDGPMCSDVNEYRGFMVEFVAERRGEPTWYPVLSPQCLPGNGAPKFHDRCLDARCVCSCHQESTAAVNGEAGAILEEWYRQPISHYMSPYQRKRATS